MPARAVRGRLAGGKLQQISRLSRFRRRQASGKAEAPSAAIRSFSRSGRLDYECILSISRLGETYVIEVGAGRVLCEQHSAAKLAEQAAAALRRRKAALMARVAVAWCALREVFEEKTEAMIAEPMDILTHVAPQLAALA
jgi:hypothetical protein